MIINDNVEKVIDVVSFSRYQLNCKLFQHYKNMLWVIFERVDSCEDLSENHLQDHKGYL
mgnify:CR=1 FL=1